MNVEELVKKHTDDKVEQLKKRMINRGVAMTENEEMIFRMGIKYGMVIGGLILVDISDL